MDPATADGDRDGVSLPAGSYYWLRPHTTATGAWGYGSGWRLLQTATYTINLPF